MHSYTIQSLTKALHKSSTIWERYIVRSTPLKVSADEASDICSRELLDASRAKNETLLRDQLVNTSVIDTYISNTMLYTLQRCTHHADTDPASLFFKNKVFNVIHENLAPKYLQTINPLADRLVNQTGYTRKSVLETLSSPLYFHATCPNGIRGILDSGFVNPGQTVLVPAAYVSAQPLGDALGQCEIGFPELAIAGSKFAITSHSENDIWVGTLGLPLTKAVTIFARDSHYETIKNLVSKSRFPNIMVFGHNDATALYTSLSPSISAPIFWSNIEGKNPKLSSDMYRPVM